MKTGFVKYKHPVRVLFTKEAATEENVKKLKRKDLDVIIFLEGGKSKHKTLKTGLA